MAVSVALGAADMEVAPKRATARRVIFFIFICCWFNDTNLMNINDSANEFMGRQAQFRLGDDEKRNRSFERFLFNH